ncbi:MAG: SulP family inorganic anion transporter, partial [Flavobacteriales bacterium]|nr:SulP family inorganic anion transporter [Flavobacteriales bacterium]
MFKTIKNDLPASIVVFFVALPLCLGIALASGAPLFSGLIAGIVGGIVVGSISGAKIGVSGPAAGLAAIVYLAIQDLGMQDFLVAVVLAGVFQILLGIVRAGIIGYYFPSSVIRGMLTGIGIIIFIKQIPFFFGHVDAKTKGFGLKDFLESLEKIETSSIIIGVVGLFILLLWNGFLSKKGK